MDLNSPLKAGPIVAASWIGHNPSFQASRERRAKDCWATTYASDLAHHRHNPSHTGTTWFADSCAEEKIVDFLADQGPALGISRQESSFLDLGTGNGSLLFALRDGGWRGRLVGVDYAPEAIKLARRLERERKEGEGEGEVEFGVWDVVSGGVPGRREEWFPEGGFDVVLDKGTFDAVSLGEEVDGRRRRVCEGYAGRVEGLVRVRGVVLVTSCNWTEEELVQWFGSGGGMEVCGRIEYPTFRFGGRTGQSVSSVCFRRVR
ncbi:hypothetical protein MMC13_007010 [Lambiella insularis]|nr:hypothetical protein [Lambiella insularis]